MTKKWIIGVSIAIAIIYILITPMARAGFGYMGYYGYHSDPSFLYWNSSQYYYDKSARSGSVKGASSRSGGPGRGK